MRLISTVSLVSAKSSFADAAPVRSEQGDGSRGRSRGERVRGLRVLHDGRPSKILGTASAFSVGLSRFCDTESPLMLKSYAVIMSEASKWFAHTRVYFDSKLIITAFLQRYGPLPFLALLLV